MKYKVVYCVSLKPVEPNPRQLCSVDKSLQAKDIQFLYKKTVQLYHQEPYKSPHHRD